MVIVIIRAVVITVANNSNNPSRAPSQPCSSIFWSLCCCFVFDLGDLQKSLADGRGCSQKGLLGRIRSCLQRVS